MIVKFLGFSLCKNIRFTFNSNDPLSNKLFKFIKECARSISLIDNFLWAFFSHAWVLKLLNLSNLAHMYIIYNFNVKKSSLYRADAINSIYMRFHIVNLFNIYNGTR